VCASFAKILQVVVLLLATATAACGCALTELRARRSRVEAPAIAHVRLAEISGDLLKFIVMNLTHERMVILRDDILLVTPRGYRTRLPGGLARVYDLPPGGAHDVNVRFDFSGLEPGTNVEIHFTRALRLRGAPVPIQPIVVEIRD
jgi:hypothetical protein